MFSRNDEGVKEFNRHSQINENGKVYLFAFDYGQAESALKTMYQKWYECHENRMRRGAYDHFSKLKPDDMWVSEDTLAGTIGDVTLFLPPAFSGSKLHYHCTKGAFGWLPKRMRDFLSYEVEEDMAKDIVELIDHEDFHTVMSRTPEVMRFAYERGMGQEAVDHMIYLTMGISGPAYDSE